MRNNQQEETVAVTTNSSKVTLKTLLHATKILLKSIHEKSNKILEKFKKDNVQGEQSLKKLMKSGQKLKDVILNDSEIKKFKKVANEYSIDFSVKKIDGKNIVFFKGKDLELLQKVMDNVLEDFGKDSLKSEQSLEELMKSGQKIKGINLNSVQLEKFREVANEYFIDFAFKKDGKNNIFFRIKDCEVLAKLLPKEFKNIILEQDKNDIVKGEKPLEKFMKTDDGVSLITIPSKYLEKFRNIAKEYYVNFAIKDIPSTGKTKIFFKNKDKELISAVMEEFLEKETRNKETKESEETKNPEENKDSNKETKDPKENEQKTIDKDCDGVEDRIDVDDNDSNVGTISDIEKRDNRDVKTSVKDKKENIKTENKEKLKDKLERGKLKTNELKEATKDKVKVKVPNVGER